ncbi:MAG: pentapeptide repeat-containing protein [Intrasporangium sp.]|uniref:pentapeptide repeat-containing protein n=1 Tax=Intrasporangium sp. TaxID=1925024 RepID=UPI002648AE71|nr:pentapeptide repeat-containing protein [Intrasporangium sp.]MDN5794360.1 pentapeptide repeat-containing protein [Intrasporangium sp.]
MQIPDQRPFPHPSFAGQDLDLDGYRFDATDFTHAHAQGRTFLECTLVACDLGEAVFRGSRWSQCAWERVHGAGISLVEASLHDIVIDQCRLGAVSAWGSQWRGVTVRGGKIDFLNLRGAKLKNVMFEDCLISELDLQEATVDAVRFDGCRLVEPQFGRGRYTGLDLTGAELVSPQGVAGLRGARVSRLQLLDLGPVLALEAGIEVAGP